MDENYTVESYRDYLIKNGLDPAIAAQVAEKTKGNPAQKTSPTASATDTAATSQSVASTSETASN